MISTINIFEYLKTIFFIILFAWISFFPAPIQEKYHLFTNVFLMLVFIILWVRKRNPIFKLSDYPLWIFLAAISINIFFAQQTNIALKTYLNVAIPLFFIYYLISEDFSSMKKFNLLARTVCISSILVSMVGILEFLFAFNPVYEYFLKNPYYLRFISCPVRPMSTQFNPTPLGGYLVGCIPFSYLLYRRDTSFFKLLGATGVILNTIVIILTSSRCGFLGLMSVIAFYLFAQRRYRYFCIFITVLLISMFVFSYLPFPFRRFGINKFIKQGVLFKPRIERMNMALHMLKDHPLAGLGFQHFRIQFYDYSVQKDKIPYEFRIADNMYLTIISETGIIGFLGFFTLVSSFLKRGWKHLRKLDFGSEQRWQLLVSLMAFIGLLVNMAGYEFFYWPNQYLLFCMVVGCLAAFSVDRRNA